ncbi:MAG: RNA helicase [Candidatus Binatia bacterium]|nr:MAG: RNA helicase [Candidatus Binatia bacterium]
MLRNAGSKGSKLLIVRSIRCNGDIWFAAIGVTLGVVCSAYHSLGANSSMARLEELERGVAVRGILPDRLVTVVDVKWYGNSVVQITYKDAEGRLGSELIYRDREATLEVVSQGAPFTFNGDGAQFRLASEAYRIRLAHLFDPLLAIHTSMIEPLPHQITAVYGEMLPRQPLRFLLADDPGAGKTIMAGLLIKELMLRGDLQRCLVCCPANLAEQWQEELASKFQLDFDIVGREAITASRTGNPFRERDLVISRLDLMSRNEDVRARLEQTEWDLVVVDEAHKLHASYSGGEVQETKRYKLGKLLGRLTRHFLLITATPHNGKEEDFQLFMALLDADRFEGCSVGVGSERDAGHLMRRMTKETLVRFDGTPLFPERFAYTIEYSLSEPEAELYGEVTDYVREEFNRADALEEGRRRTVGFALTILQRRLASSPEAIYQSLKRRRERLEKRLQGEDAARRHTDALSSFGVGLGRFTQGDIEDLDELDEMPGAELEEIEDTIVDQATAARTIAELKAEIATLRRLEELALQLRRRGTDTKWEKLSEVLQSTPEMFHADGSRRKLVVFTEHRDTLNYLSERLRKMLGHEAVVAIHGGLGREQRREAQDLFTKGKNVQVLVATDAAGEGINLQQAHLMVNYDLPWNPNRLEQRFGRIHRIGQTEVCHLWNLVARETREGEVFAVLLRKLAQQRQALGGRVYDVLGRVFRERSLRELLVEAVRYGEKAEVRERLRQVVDSALDTRHLQQLLEEHALTQEALDSATIRRIREDLERVEARRLQPHFIGSFFLEALRHLGGTVRDREPFRYEVTHVPATVRSRRGVSGRAAPIASRYERITFQRELVNVPGKPAATLICPGHPLLDAIVDLILERYRDLLKQGTILVDPREDVGGDVRVLFYLEHAIQDARTDPRGQRRIVSRRLEFIEMARNGEVFAAGYAPYLDYRPITGEERPLIEPELDASWLIGDLESKVVSYAIQHVVPRHLEELQRIKEEMVSRTMAAVRERLTREIQNWRRRAEDLHAQELAGKSNARINSAKANDRVQELEARLRRRLEELEQERRLSPLPPIVVGGAFVVPLNRIRSRNSQLAAEADPSSPSTSHRKRLAMDAVIRLERELGREARDVSGQHLGYDVESRDPKGSRLRFIAVKGVPAGAERITLSRNEVFTALNKGDDFSLALVEVDGANAGKPTYVRCPLQNLPDFTSTAVTYSVEELKCTGESPV